jgi:hypothetical protein
MKWNVLVLFLLLGVVCSVSAQSMDARLVGAWETQDGPCSPCILTIPASGKVTFTQVGDAIEVMYAQGTPEPGIDVILPQGGKLELALNKKGDRLVGFYTNWTQNRKNMPVVFDRK